MNAEEIIAFADTLRAYALESSDDLNAANLFAHAMLMRKFLAERQSREMCDWQHEIESDAA